MLRKDAQVFAEQELNRYGLIDAGWKFEINERSKRQLGCCYYGRKVIALTGWYIDMNPPEIVHDTILHEIAHALAGSEAGHGPAWVTQCLRVGAKPNRLRQSATINKPASKFMAVCQCCSTRFDRSNFPRTRSYYCPCTRGSADRAPLSWQVNTSRVVLATTGPGSMRDAAQDMEMPRPDSAIESLLVELRLSVDAEQNKRIRAKLRKLGHKGGLR